MPFRDPYAMDIPHYTAACRTIVAAAKGGKLRALELLCHTIEEPFAMRSLVPACWVSCVVDDYNEKDAGEGSQEHGSVGKLWLKAAIWIRPALAHASLWLHTSLFAPPRNSRMLTTVDVQSILRYFKSSNFGNNGTGLIMAEPYLRWFEQDAELTQQVSEAWNTVVERGKAGLADCECRRCRAHRAARVSRSPQISPSSARSRLV